MTTPIAQVLKIVLFVPLVLMAALSTPGHAQSEWTSWNCDNPGNQLELNQCAGITFRETDARMLAEFEKMAEYFDLRDPRDGEDFRASQEAWIVFRDKACNRHLLNLPSDSGRTGSITPLAVSSCMKTVTEQRIKMFCGFVFVGSCPEGIEYEIEMMKEARAKNATPEK